MKITWILFLQRETRNVAVAGGVRTPAAVGHLILRRGPDFFLTQRHPPFPLPNGNITVHKGADREKTQEQKQFKVDLQPLPNLLTEQIEPQGSHGEFS